MTDKLLACPNEACGSEEAPYYSADVTVRGVLCPICWVNGPSAGTEAKAIALWNNLPRKLPWIKIGEGELPEEDRPYWVSQKSREDCPIAYYSEYGWVSTTEGEGFLHNVLYYQLIPDPGLPSDIVGSQAGTDKLLEDKGE